MVILFSSRGARRQTGDGGRQDQIKIGRAISTEESSSTAAGAALAFVIKKKVNSLVPLYICRVGWSMYQKVFLHISRKA